MKIWFTAEYCNCCLRRGMYVRSKGWPGWIESHPVIHLNRFFAASRRISRWLLRATQKRSVRLGMLSCIYCAPILARKFTVLHVKHLIFSFFQFFLLLSLYFFYNKVNDAQPVTKGTRVVVPTETPVLNFYKKGNEIFLRSGRQHWIVTQYKADFQTSLHWCGFISWGATIWKCFLSASLSSSSR